MIFLILCGVKIKDVILLIHQLNVIVKNLMIIFVIKMVNKVVIFKEVVQEFANKIKASCQSVMCRFKILAV